MNSGRSIWRRLSEHFRRGSILHELQRRLRWMAAPRAARFLDRARGVIHVGANVGQEREAYSLYGLNVLWIEPVQETFERLLDNIKVLPGQRAVRALISDEDDLEVRFHVASNGGGSSSMLELAQHRDIWPAVHFQRSEIMRTVRLATLIEREGLSPVGYDVLVMDTQGTELRVLRGAEPLLAGFRFVRTEAADFEAYVGCCRVDDIATFLTERGFREVHRQSFAERPGGGRYFDLIFERVAPGA